VPAHHPADRGHGPAPAGPGPGGRAADDGRQVAVLRGCEAPAPPHAAAGALARARRAAPLPVDRDLRVRVRLVPALPGGTPAAGARGTRPRDARPDLLPAGPTPGPQGDPMTPSSGSGIGRAGSVRSIMKWTIIAGALIAIVIGTIASFVGGLVAGLPGVWGALIGS